MKCLAIDYGEKRIGVAMSDDIGIVADRQNPILNKSDKFAINELSKICTEQNIDMMIVGIPDGSFERDKKQIDTIKRFAERLESQINISIKFWNESFSSVEAGQNIKSKKKIKKHIDSESARIILQEYLNYVNSQQ